MAESAATPFKIVDIGPVARRALVNGACGRVEAVFERSFYMIVDDQWICLGPDGLGSGPLNALYRSLPPHAGELCRPVRGDSVRVLDDALQVGQGIFAGIGRAAEPGPVIPSDWSTETLAAGLQAFDALDQGMFPADGLAPLCRSRAGHPRSAILARADGPAACLADLVRASAAGLRVDGGLDAGPLVSLLGLGPGLTPSGDDLLGGALVVMQTLGLDDLRDIVWGILRARAMTDTNEISFAHLSAAAEGHCSAALRRILNTLMSASPGDLHTDLRAVARIGHTSGWDALAGILIVLRAFRDAQPDPAATRFLNPPRPD